VDTSNWNSVPGLARVRKTQKVSKKNRYKFVQHPIGVPSSVGGFSRDMTASFSLETSILESVRKSVQSQKNSLSCYTYVLFEEVSDLPICEFEDTLR
jgi:hypothetical protein